MAEPVSDLELVNQIKNGDTSKFNILVERYYNVIYKEMKRNVKNKEFAEDITQDTMIRMIDKIKLFNTESFRGWLMTIAYNVMYNKYRKMKRMVSLDHVDLMTDHLEEELINKQAMGVVTEQLQLLPNKQRKAVMLHVVDDLPFKDVAEIMNCPYDTAKANYRHGMLKLKDIIGG